MRYLVETTDDVNIITEGKESNKKLYLEGITLQGDIVNQNKRKYPFPILKEAIGKYVNGHLYSNRAVGELDHPTENLHKINPDRISHKFVEVREDGNNFITKALVLETICGKQVRNLIEGEVKIGMSQRGFGKTKNDNGVALVETLHLITLADIVIDPSAPDAFSQAIFENKEWVFENGVFVGVDVGSEIDKTKAILENASKKDREQALISVFTEYLEKIKLK